MDRGYAIGTNEPYHIFDGFIPEEQLLHVDLAEPFPLIDDGIDIVFDLAGSLSKQAQSISTAIAQSDWVFVPIYNEVKAIKAGLNTLAEVMTLNSNVAVIATKLQKRGRSDRFSEWSDSADMRNIQRAVHQQF